MANPPISTTLTNPPDLETITRRVTNLVQLHKTFKDDDDVHVSAAESNSNPTDSDTLLKDCALHLYNKVDQILSEYTKAELLGFDELEPFFEELEGELQRVEAENAKIAEEIEVVNGTYVEDLKRLECDLESLQDSLASAASQGSDKALGSARGDGCMYTRDHFNVETAQREDKFQQFILLSGDMNPRNWLLRYTDYLFPKADISLPKQILKLNDQIENNIETLKLLSDLNDIYRRFEATEDFEDSMTGIKVLGFDKGCIRVALTTYIPYLESISCQHKLRDIREPNELSHELIIEVMDGSMELKNAEIFPNDVCITEIIDAAKSFRHFSQSLTLDTRSSLGWFVTKVQDKIILCTLRKYVIKNLTNSRHSFEYSDRDEMIVAHMVGGVSAFVKVSQGWPSSTSALKLVSLKTSDLHSEGMSLSFLCKVEEAANALDMSTRQNLASFVDAIEETLKQQMSLELHFDAASRKQPRVS